MNTQDEFDYAKACMAEMTGPDCGFRAAFAFTVALQMTGIVSAEMDERGNAIWIFADHIDTKTRHQLLDMRNFLLDLGANEKFPELKGDSDETN